MTTLDQHAQPTTVAELLQRAIDLGRDWAEVEWDGMPEYPGPYAYASAADVLTHIGDIDLRVFPARDQEQACAGCEQSRRVRWAELLADAQKED